MAHASAVIAQRGAARSTDAERSSVDDYEADPDPQGGPTARADGQFSSEVIDGASTSSSKSLAGDDVGGEDVPVAGDASPAL